MAKWLNENGEEIITAHCDAGRERLVLPAGVEYVHCWNLRPAVAYRDQINVPLGVTFHGYVDQNMLLSYAGTLKNRVQPNWVHVMEYRSQMDLAQHGVFSHYTTQCVDFEGLSKQPFSGPITLGYLGGDPVNKRFSVVREIAKQAGVGINGYGGDGINGRWLTREEVAKLHGEIGVFVSAHLYPGAGPVPPIEALACGRPVLATPCETLKSLQKTSCAPIVFFNGSVEDGVKKLQRLLEVHEDFVAAALDWEPPHDIQPFFVAPWFQEHVREAVDNA